MNPDDPAASLHVALGIGRGITIGRAHALAACRRIVELTSRPICGTPHPDAAQVLALAERVIAQDWPIDQIVAREEHREPDWAAAGGWVWAVYRDDDAMMAELYRRAMRGPA